MKIRDIKFRAWSLTIKEMVDLPIFCQCSQGDSPDVTFNESLEVTNEYYIPMQYIGLKDKNGVEVYEGDIIEKWDGNKFCIEYEGLLYRPSDKKYRAKVPFLVSSDIASSKVIGNIYENPELLK